MDDVLTELRIATESIDRYGSAQRRKNDATDSQIAQLWEAIAEGRDELLAVANRLEALTRVSIMRAGPCSECGQPIYMDAAKLWRGDDGELHTCQAVRSVRDADS